MKRTLLTIVSLFLFYNSQAQVKEQTTIVPDKKPIGSAQRKKLPIIDRPQSLRPRSDSPLGNSFSIDRKMETKPDMTLQEYNMLKPGIMGIGEVAEEEINPWGFAPNPKFLNRWYRDITGFRAFLDYGFTVGVGKDANHRLEWFGTFGYQFNPIFYLGVGQSYLLSVNKQESTAPTYANLRVNFLDEYTTPYLDLKGGYSFIENKGVFLNPNVGMSFGKNRRAWNIGLGYSFQRAKIKKNDVYTNLNYHGVSLKVTYEFSIFK